MGTLLGSDQIDFLVNAIADDIDGCWTKDCLRLDYCNDGDGYMDFMGMRITGTGIERLRAAIVAAMEKIP
jgi:hypothetical protein